MHWEDNATFDATGEVIFDETHRLNEDPLVRHYYSTAGKTKKIPRTSSELQRITASQASTVLGTTASIPLLTSTTTVQMVEKETRVLRDVMGKVNGAAAGAVGGGRWKSMLAGGLLLGMGFVAGVGYARNQW